MEAANMGLEKVSPDEIDEDNLIDSKIAWDFE